jgi:hypothetical protein
MTFFNADISSAPYLESLRAAKALLAFAKASKAELTSDVCSSTTISV